MELGSIFLSLALLIAVFIFVSRPLFERVNAPLDTQIQELEHEYSALMADRDRILDALQELDFDYALGKIPEEDYKPQRNRLLARGADVLRELDAQAGNVDGEISEPADDVDARLEAAIAARRADTRREEGADGSPSEDAVAHSTRSIADPDDNLEYLIANRRRNRQDKSAGFCPKCGGPVQKSDHFCPKCGMRTG